MWFVRPRFFWEVGEKNWGVFQWKDWNCNKGPGGVEALVTSCHTHVWCFAGPKTVLWYCWCLLLPLKDLLTLKWRWLKWFLGWFSAELMTSHRHSAWSSMGLHGKSCCILPTLSANHVPTRKHGMKSRDCHRPSTVFHGANAGVLPLAETLESVTPLTTKPQSCMRRLSITNSLWSSSASNAWSNAMLPFHVTHLVDSILV